MDKDKLVEAPIVDEEQLHVAYLVLRDRYMKSNAMSDWEERIKAGLRAAMPHLAAALRSHAQPK